MKQPNKEKNLCKCGHTLDCHFGWMLENPDKCFALGCKCIKFIPSHSDSTRKGDEQVSPPKTCRNAQSSEIPNETLIDENKKHTWEISQDWNNSKTDDIVWIPFTFYKSLIAEYEKELERLKEQLEKVKQ